MIAVTFIVPQEGDNALSRFTEERLLADSRVAVRVDRSGDTLFFEKLKDNLGVLDGSNEQTADEIVLRLAKCVVA